MLVASGERGQGWDAACARSLEDGWSLHRGQRTVPPGAEPTNSKTGGKGGCRRRGDRAACGRGRAGARDRGAARPQSPACVSLGPLQRAVSVGWCRDCTEEDEGETETNENASQRPCYEGRETPMTKKRTKGRGQVLVFFCKCGRLKEVNRKMWGQQREKGSEHRKERRTGWRVFLRRQAASSARHVVCCRCCHSGRVLGHGGVRAGVAGALRIAGRLAASLLLILDASCIPKPVQP